MISALDVTKLILYFANRDGDLITNLKLQKLLYYMQVWYLVNFDKKPLFIEEIEAWDFGPVVKEVYHEFKEFKHSPINMDVEEDVIRKKLHKNTIDFIEYIYGKYIGFSAYDLVDMAHNEKPYINARKTVSKIIDKDEIYDYFLKLYENDSE